MSGYLHQLRARLTNRPDSEHAQAMVRLTIALLILAYLWGLQALQAEPRVAGMMLVMLAESVIGIGLVTAILVNPARSHLRRWIGMVADYSTLGILMSISPSALAPLYVLIMWVTIGNGLRYGPHYLYSATALGAFAFLLVAVNSDYWLGQRYLSIGLWIGLIAIPLYLSSLLHSLHRITEEARRANAAKTRFLATMSHEFRSPLNGIIGMSELLQGTRLAAAQREYAEVIHASAQSLALLVDDVLDISAIEAGKLQRRDADFSLTELLERLDTMLQPQAAAKGISLTTRVEPGVPSRLHGDGAHLTQILTNLLHNAVKFTDSGSVALGVSVVSRHDALVDLRFSVRDTGVGIPEKDKARIFEAFEQVESGPTRRYGGTGLGTTIAKTLAQLLDGHIGLEDNPGGGSHFWLDVPMQVQAGGIRDQAPDSANIVAFDDPFIRHRARVKSLRVLVADDQLANRTVLTRILERAGHRVIVAVGGEDALDRLEVSDVDIAILDMHMPVFSGLDVVRQLRVMQAGQKRRTPVIVLSADATEQAARDAIEAGARAFLSKPVVVAKLLEAITEALAPAKGDAAPARPIAPRTNPAVLEELASMGLGAEFLENFVEQCLRDASACVVQLASAGRERRWDIYRDNAHAIKGVAANLGATTVVERCLTVMRAGDDVLEREHARWAGELEAQLSLVAEQSRGEVARILGNRQRDGESRPSPDVS